MSAKDKLAALALAPWAAPKKILFLIVVVPNWELRQAQQILLLLILESLQ
jgi:hypothetical protein